MFVPVLTDPILYVGDQDSYEKDLREWFEPTGNDRKISVIHACKEPYHRKLLGYTGRGAPKEHPEYLLATRPGRLFLNFVDTPDKKYVRTELIESALAWMRDARNAGEPCLVHCNEGRSRAPLLAMLFLAAIGRLPSTLPEALIEFKKLYEPFDPSGGVAGFLEENYHTYVHRFVP